MGYVFNEIFWWMLGALLVGFALGWLFWKCRVWFGRNDQHEEQVAELASTADRHAARVTQLSGELDTKTTRLASMEGRLAESGVELGQLQTRIRELEPIEAEAERLSARVENRNLRQIRPEFRYFLVPVMRFIGRRFLKHFNQFRGPRQLTHRMRQFVDRLV